MFGLFTVRKCVFGLLSTSGNKTQITKVAELRVVVVVVVVVVVCRSINHGAVPRHAWLPTARHVSATQPVLYQQLSDLRR